MVEPFGTYLRFGERTVDLGQPVVDILRVDGLVVAFTERGSAPPRSVYAFEPDGTRRWRIEPPPDDAPADRGLYYTDAWVAGEELWVRSTTRRLYRVSLKDGSLESDVPETAIPVDEKVVDLDRPVESFVRVGDLTVALLDHTRAPDGSLGEPPGPRNVVAFDRDGSERWRIEPLALEARTNDLWSWDDSPRPLQQTDSWDSIAVDGGELVAEHSHGTEVTVDPSDGSIAIRNVSAVDDRMVFPGGDVVELPDPVWKTAEVDDVVLAMLGTHREASNWDERNVLAFDRDGEQLWRVEGREGTTTYFDTVWTIGDDVYLRRPDGLAFGLDLSSGALGDRYEPNEVPLPDGVLVFPQAVSSLAYRDDAVAVCVDVLGDAPSFDIDDRDASEHEGTTVAVVRDPLPDDANVEAFDASGGRLWRVECLREGDSYTGVGNSEGRLYATTWNGKHLDVDWQTGETSRNTNVLW